MNRQRLRSGFGRFPALLLCLSLALPHPAYALRTEANVESGLEEKLRLALREEDPGKAVVAAVARQIFNTLGIPTPPVIPATTGLEEYFTDLLKRASGIKLVSVEGDRHFYRTEDEIVMLVAKGADLVIGLGEYPTHSLRVRDEMSQGSRVFRLIGKEYTDLKDTPPVQWVDQKTDRPVIMDIKYEVTDPDEAVLTIVIDPRAEGIPELKMRVQGGDFPHNKWIFDGTGTPILRNSDLDSQRHKHTKSVLIQLQKPTSIEASATAGLEEVTPVILQVGHPEYERFFPSNSSVFDSLYGPIAAYIRELPPNQPVVLRLDPETPERAEELQREGLVPLADAGKEWSWARQNPRQIAFLGYPDHLEIQHASPDHQAIRIYPPSGIGSFETAALPDKVSRALRQLADDDPREVNRDRAAFLSSLDSLISSGRLRLGPMIHGFRTPKQADSFASAYDVPPANFLSEEGFVALREQQKREKDKKDREQTLTKLQQALRSQAVVWSEKAGFRIQQVGRYLTPRKAAELAALVRESTVQKIAENALGKETIIPDTEIGPSANQAMTELSEKFDRLWETAVSEPLAGNDLKQAVAELVGQFPELRRSDVSAPEFLPADQVNRMTDDYARFFGARRQKSGQKWTPALAALLLAEMQKAWSAIRSVTRENSITSRYYRVVFFEGSAQNSPSVINPISKSSVDPSTRDLQDASIEGFVVNLNTDAYSTTPKDALMNALYYTFYAVAALMVDLPTAIYLSQHQGEIPNGDVLAGDVWNDMAGLLPQLSNLPGRGQPFNAEQVARPRIIRAWAIAGGMQNNPWLQGPQLPMEHISNKPAMELWAVASGAHGAGRTISELVQEQVTGLLGRDFPQVRGAVIRQLEVELAAQSKFVSTIGANYQAASIETAAERYFSGMARLGGLAYLEALLAQNGQTERISEVQHLARQVIQIIRANGGVIAQADGYEKVDWAAVYAQTVADYKILLDGIRFRNVSTGVEEIVNRAVEASGGTLQAVRNMRIATFAPSPEVDGPLTSAARQVFEDLAREAIARRGQFVVALSGGRTPQLLYQLLAQSPDVEWDKVHIFSTDERKLSADGPGIGYQVVETNLLNKLPDKKPTVHRVDVNIDPETAARAYEEEIRQLLGDELQFDLMITGAGADRHILSLLPESPVVTNSSPKPVEVIWHKDAYQNIGYSLTQTLLQRARQVVLVLTGEEKRQILQELVNQDGIPSERPILLMDQLPPSVLSVFTDQPLTTGVEELPVTPEVFAGMMDHTNLTWGADKASIQATAREARALGTALIAIRPGMPAIWAADILKGSKVRVGPAIGFGLLRDKWTGEGLTREQALARYDVSIDDKKLEMDTTVNALHAWYPDVGVEIDFVINVAALMDPQRGEVYVENEIRQLIEHIRLLENSLGIGHITTKVIGENYFLNSEQMRKVYGWAKQYGADFVKTATGFAPTGAKAEDLAFMREIVGPEMGLKAAGGVRTVDDALAMIKAAGLREISSQTFRIGTSAAVTMTQEYRSRYGFFPGRGIPASKDRALRSRFSERVLETLGFPLGGANVILPAFLRGELPFERAEDLLLDRPDAPQSKIKTREDARKGLVFAWVALRHQLTYADTDPEYADQVWWQPIFDYAFAPVEQKTQADFRSKILSEISRVQGLRQRGYGGEDYQDQPSEKILEEINRLLAYQTPPTAGLEEGNWRLSGPIPAGELSERWVEITYNLARAGIASASIHTPTRLLPQSRAISRSVHIRFGHWDSILLEGLQRSADPFPEEDWYPRFGEAAQILGIGASEAGLPDRWFISADAFQRGEAAGSRTHVRITAVPFVPEELTNQVPLPSEVETLGVYLHRIIAMYQLLADEGKADVLRVRLKRGPGDTVSADLTPSTTTLTENEEPMARLSAAVQSKSTLQARNIVWPRGFSVQREGKILEVTLAIKTAGLEEQGDANAPDVLFQRFKGHLDELLKNSGDRDEIYATVRLPIIQSFELPDGSRVHLAYVTADRDEPGNVTGIKFREGYDPFSVQFTLLLGGKEITTVQIPRHRDEDWHQELLGFARRIRLRAAEESPGLSPIELLMNKSVIRQAWQKRQGIPSDSPAAGLEEIALSPEVSAASLVVLTPATVEALSGLARLGQGGVPLRLAVIVADNAQEARVRAGLEEIGAALALQKLVNLSRTNQTLGEAIVSLQVEAWADAIEVLVVDTFKQLRELGRFLKIPDVSFRSWLEWAQKGLEQAA